MDGQRPEGSVRRIGPALRMHVGRRRPPGSARPRDVWPGACGRVHHRVVAVVVVLPMWSSLRSQALLVQHFFVYSRLCAFAQRRRQDARQRSAACANSAAGRPRRLRRASRRHLRRSCAWHEGGARHVGGHPEVGPPVGCHRRVGEFDAEVQNRARAQASSRGLHSDLRGASLS